jgi:hypothetical protein
MMRTRETIERFALDGEQGQNGGWQSGPLASNQVLILEVLLDCRDLLEAIAIRAEREIPQVFRQPETIKLADVASTDEANRMLVDGWRLLASNIDARGRTMHVLGKAAQ